jgi:adenosylcobinamide kinase/adenosylcobinamide-phosphate guanylyltransferase
LGYVILVTGGSRSGKSEYAERVAEALGGSKVFVATCPPVDREMEERIRNHKNKRAQRGWLTIEEQVDLARILRETKSFSVVLVDCLTLWVNNLMFLDPPEQPRITEEEIARRCEELVLACGAREGTAIFVTNEIGMGIVPDNPASRLFRDLVGRCNQTMAQAADQVTLVVCGLPLHLKKKETK